jgi:hypothetical protein
MPALNPKYRRPVKAIEIILTLFYGQFIANALYDNFIRGIPELVREPTAYYNIIKVVLGAVIIAATGFSITAIWWRKKHINLIFASAVTLIVIFLIALIINIIDIVKRQERGYISGNEIPILGTILAVESLLRIAAIALTFVLTNLLKKNYELVASTA